MKKKEESKDKLSPLDLALTAVNKKHGSTVRWLNDVPDCGIEFISTGSLSLDYALGGGFVRGRISEIFGWEGTGKSTLALGVAAEANAMGLTCLYIDAERALDPKMPLSYGVDPDKFILENGPITAEQHFEIIESLVSSGEIGMCVVDSVTSLMPRSELEGNIGDTHVGLLARFLSQECRKLVQLLGETNTMFIFINQFREKIMRVPGDPKVTSGGNAIKFYATHRVEVSGTGKTASGRIPNERGEAIGHIMKYKVLKNKVGLPYRSGEIDLIYGKGYDSLGELINVGESLSIISRNGAWYSYGGEKIQGKDGFKSFLLDKPKIKKDLLIEVKDVLGLPLSFREKRELADI